MLANPGNQVLTVGDQNYSLQIINTGGDGTWTVSAGTLPAGLSINSTTGEITGVPTTEATSREVTIKATNPSGANDSVTFNFTIVLPVPDFSLTSSRTYLQGDTVSLLPPTNTGGAVATWSASGLPAGLTISSSTGLITGTASTSQSATDATITATNSGGQVSYSQSFTVTAMAPPSLSTVADVRLTINTEYTLQFSNSGYTSTWSATGLPAGFSIDAATGDITGSSTVEVSSRQVTITAQNYAGTDSKSFSFAVVQPIPVIGTISAQTLTRGSVVSITAPSNSGGPVASWSATGLPSGLTINSGTGAITGTPSTLQTATDATISATNSGGSATTTISITINDVTPSL
ncbi:MAG: hypothetical protein EBU89_04595, partial [Actinobacteria bacterium]|nr:hypothetical protein [Actinomycetota bacterium]